ncbi:MAG: acyltransferase [Rhodocyclaceae bacterium]|nr:acyltransferase [Rhodocyclaceae bacterium]
MQTTGTRAAPQLVSLQALRFLAAGMVVYVHALSTYADKVAPVGATLTPAALGEFGVKLFFCISGYIIYLSSGQLRAGAASALDFMQRRLTRIVPLYWTATLLYAAKLAAQGDPPAVLDIVRSLLFLPYADTNGLMRPVLGVGWSLNYEMMFYLLFAGTLLLRPARRPVALALALAVLLCFHHVLPPAATAGALHVGLYLLGDHYLLYFLAGLAVAWLQNDGRLYRRLPRFAPRTTILALLGLIALYCAPVLILSMPRLTLESLMAVVCIACLLLCTLERQGADTPPAPAVRLLKLGGDASYCTYLTHGFVMGPAARLIDLLGQATGPLPFAFAMLALCSAAGILLYCVFEKPLLRKVAAWLRPPVPPQLKPDLPYGK